MEAKKKKLPYKSILMNRFIIVALATIGTPFIALGNIWPNVSFPSNPPAAVTPEGYLDVTKAPYNLDSNGGNATTNTAQLQAAINYAYNNNLAVFFPAGTYDVNNQLELFQKEDFMTQCHVLVGSAAGTARPLIRVQGGSFGNASNPKPVFHFYCSPSGNGPAQDPADLARSGYNMVFRGIDIDLNGKAGAIGIRMHAAQGSTIQDVKVTATGAFAGIESLPGSSAIHANIHVEGGRYAFYVTDNRPMPVLTGITCVGQTIRPIHFNGNLEGPLTIVGFHIESSASGPLFDLSAGGRSEHLSLVDGSIEVTSGNAIIIKNRNRSLYLRNVYMKSNGKVVDNVSGANPPDISGSSNWAHVGDYCYFHISNRQIINGSYSTGVYGVNTITKNSSVQPETDLVSRHLWDESTFPHFEDGNVIFVGPNDGPGNDDSAAIQSAIDSANGKAVFLKKGDYNLKRSLVFKNDTKLVGVSRNLTRLHCDNSWSESSYDTPMIKTPPNGANATCMIAWLALHMPLNEGKKITFLNWTAGRHSMVREVHFRKDPRWNCPVYPVKRIKISGTGGGRWYSVFTRAAAEQGEHSNHRMLYVTGTTEPLSIYAHTVEYQESQVYMTEINGAQNVSMYGFKIETDLNSGDDGGVYKHTPALGIVNSQNIIVVGGDGYGELDPNESTHGLIEVAGNSDDVQVMNISGGWGKNTGFGIVRDMGNGKVIKKNKLNTAGDPASLYSKGNPNPIVYTPEATSPPPGTASLIELESTMPPVASSGDNSSSATNTAASGGGFVWYGSNAVGDFITLDVNIPNAGTHQIYAGIGTTPSSGKFQLKINGANVGAAQDLYSTAYIFEERSLGSYHFASSGIHQFRYEITGKHASSSNYIIRLDSLRIEAYEGGNTAPVLVAINNSSVNEGGNSTVSFSATDADNDPITLSATGVPSFAVLADNGDGTGSISFSPGYSNSGNYTITVTAVDGNGGNDSDTFTVTVNHVNRPPNLNPIANVTMNENGTHVVNLTANDPDGDLLLCSVSDCPSFGVPVDNGDGTETITFNPGFSDSGVYSLSVIFDDNNGGTDTESFTVTVNNTNQAPTISTIIDSSVNETATTTVNFSATDADSDPISFSATGLPSFGTLNDNGDGTGSLIFAPGYEDSGVFSITVSADDENGGADSDAFNLTVNNINRQPTITAIANQSVDENSNLNVLISSSDPDSGDTLTLSTTGLPAFGNLNDNGDGTGILSFNPGNGDAGVYHLTVTVNDGNASNNVNSINFALTVTPAQQSTAFYENDFSSGSIAPDFAGNTNDYTISGGTLKPTTKWKRIYLNTPGASTLTDYTVEVDATTITPGSGNRHTAPVMLRYQSSSQFYLVQIDKNGKLLILKKDGGWTTLGSSASGAFPVSVSYKIDIYGSNPTTIDVYVNGAQTPSLSGTDSASPYLQGPPAFEARGTTSMEWDNLVVTEGGALYANDFESGTPDTDFDPGNGTINDWSFDSFGTLHSETQWWTIYLSAADAGNWTDYTLTVDVDNLAPGTGNKQTANVLVRYNQASPNNYYGILIDKQNNLYIGKKAGGWNWGLASTTGGLFDHTIPHTLKVDVRGSSTVTIDVYVDGAQTPSLTAVDNSNPHTSGGVGFENRGLEVAFDNLVVE